MSVVTFKSRTLNLTEKAVDSYLTRLAFFGVIDPKTLPSSNYLLFKIHFSLSIISTQINGRLTGPMLLESSYLPSLNTGRPFVLCTAGIFLVL